MEERKYQHPAFQNADAPGVPHPRELFLAIRYGDAPELAQLIKAGANPNWKNRRGDETALAYASLVSTKAVVRVLLENGATDDGTMPLENAVSFGDGDDGNPDSTEIARLLLTQGSGDVNRPDENGYTPLMMACGAGDVPTARLFLDYGADPNAKARNGTTASDMTPERNAPEIAALLQAASNKRLANTGTAG